MSPEIMYLHARYDELEDAAKAASTDQASWVGTDGKLYHAPSYGHPHDVVAVGLWGDIEDADLAHIVLNDPAYVLADVAAKRAILDLHEQWPVLLERIQPGPVERHTAEHIAPNLTAWIEWTTTQEYRKRFGKEPPTSTIIQAMLQPYADRDDFDPTWRTV
jgi:uncharacterized protein DUF6221